ncbi:hypothetical protein SDC9_82267 [bioreactor metagenome]|uniref:Ribbon-helix-helix protein CopG domain-containing protein n=1 Tax=bioreactor metagenome TaxID=1076179 RepID=A0A644ZCR0_9ZZZZ|nr:hypothetical protein [Lachnospiraceae bacterium]
MKTEKVKTTIYMDKGLLNQLEKCRETYGYKSKNEFIIKAVKDHIATKTLESESDIFAEKLADAIQKQTDTLSKRVSKGLYRYAVELSMIMHILAAQIELDDETIKILRGRAMREVKGLRGKLCLEAIADHQNGIDNPYYKERVDC